MSRSGFDSRDVRALREAAQGVSEDLPRFAQGVLADLPAAGAPDLAALPLAVPLRGDLPFRLYRLHEIGEDKAGARRQSLANVFSTLQQSGCACVYVVAGSPQGVRVFFGVAGMDEEADVPAAASLLKNSFEGNFPGAQLETVRDDSGTLHELFAPLHHFGYVTGVPSLNAGEAQGGSDDTAQGMERLANSLMGATWQLVIVAEPGSPAQIEQAQRDVHDMASRLSEHLRQSGQSSENFSFQTSHTKGDSETKTEGTNNSDTKGKSEGASKTDSASQTKSNDKSESKTTGSSKSTATGTSHSHTQGGSYGSSYTRNHERTNKHVESLLKHADETLEPRFGRGRAKGMYRTTVYLAADVQGTWQRLASGVAAIFQGNQPSFTPLRAHRLPAGMRLRGLGDLLQPLLLEQGRVRAQDAAFHSLPLLAGAGRSGGIVQAGAWLNGEELGLIAGLPDRELPGLRVRKSVDFAVNTAPTAATTSTASATSQAGQAIELGRIVQNGRELPLPVHLPLADLNRHVFITGVTGAGKTTTCLKLLMDSGLPFLVIEPAKTEYRALHAQGQAQGQPIDYYCLGREDLTPFRLNPFELLSPRQMLPGHIDTLKATLTAVFPMEAAMPQIVNEAIHNAYKAKGWHVEASRNLLVDDPFARGSNAWPTFSDVIDQLDAVIKSKGMGKEFEEKYLGSLVARLSDLTVGVKGRMLNTPHSMDFDQLLDRRVVIELEEIRDAQDKALFMGLILGRMAECVRLRHANNPRFRHLTLVEEAHRLLSRPEPGEGGARRLGVEMFANLLAEVRKYGEGLIIADQIPDKLVPDVIKNTNTKIVHRLFDAHDRQAVGDAIGLSGEQKDFLPQLKAGETVIYCGGWHAPVRMQVAQGASTSGPGPDEALLREQGQKQYWQQRRRLLPHLADHPQLQTPASLTQFAGDALVMLQLLVQLVPKATPDDEARRAHMRRLVLRLRDAWQDAGMSAPVLAAALCSVLRDAVAQSVFVTDERFAALEPHLHGGLQRLQESQAAFDAYVLDGSEGRFDFERLGRIKTF